MFPNILIVLVCTALSRLTRPNSTQFFMFLCAQSKSLKDFTKRYHVWVSAEAPAKTIK